MPATVAQNPETKEKVVLLTLPPDIYSAERVVGLLRLLRAHFPDEYQAVHLEILAKPNGRLLLPEG